MSDLPKRLRDLADKFSEGWHDGIKIDATDIELLADAAAALTEPEQSEPIAWMVTAEMQDGSLNTYPLAGRYKDAKDACDRGEPVPLFAAPPRREPLAEKKILKLVPFTLQHITDGVLVGFARALEAAHGITGGKG